MRRGWRRRPSRRSTGAPSSTDPLDCAGCTAKGTTHITFTDEALLKRFNIYGCQHKSWLPPSYGRKAYKDMDTKEKAVIDDYEGEKEYGETMRNAQYFLGACTNIYPALTDSA